MRTVEIGREGAVPRLEGPPAQLPDAGFVWLSFDRDKFAAELPLLTAALAGWGLAPIVELHVSDLLNAQLPSHYDYTSWYDLLVFRRLAVALPDGEHVPLAETIDTSPVGMVVFDRVLVTVHPPACGVREHFGQRLQSWGGRLPSSPADLMLRMANHMVDSYLDLRRLLSRQQAELQEGLLAPAGRFADWRAVLAGRYALHHLEDTCEDQRSAVQEWIDALDEWGRDDADAPVARERELLAIRSRDLLEHIARVLAHVRRLEQAAETAVQMHFTATAQRTNDIMRTLTVLTAIFLPMNLITGFFGMNFDYLPLVKLPAGVWITLGAMAAVALVLGGFFWRRRYLGTRRR
jgi:magnesium transporter